MALYPDAHVRLKNKDAETNDYAEIRQIRVPSASGGFDVFTHMESLRCYVVKPTSATNYYKVVTLSLNGIGIDNSVSVAYNNSIFEDETYYYEDGDFKFVRIILTTKALTVGQTYHISEF